MIKNKWKIFAMGQILADWNSDAVAIFDAITGSTNDEANKHFEHFEYNPDARFRDCVKMFFPRVRKILVSFPSLVDHMNIGSAIYKNKNVNKGHKAKFYIGSLVDPKLYEENL
jgi:hypothetical protein